MIDKEEFLIRQQSLNDEISKAKVNLRDLEDDYISQNKEFEVGEKVKVITPMHERWGYMSNELVQQSERIAFVDGFLIGCYGDICYHLKKAKKDGTVGMHRDHYSRIDKLEKLSIDTNPQTKGGE